MHFARTGHEVHAIDDYLRRRAHQEAGTDSLTPIGALAAGPGRGVPRRSRGLEIGVTEGDLTDWSVVERLFREFRPEAIVHYGEMPSAPYSMNRPRARRVHADEQRREHAERAVRDGRDRARRATWSSSARWASTARRTSTSRRATSRSSTTGARTRCRSRSCPGRCYHLSKVHDSHNIHFACRIWGLRATDLNQGVVYGIETEETKLDERLLTRFDYDEVFGTALNRFCLQAVIGQPLTVYGKGGQTRGYLNIVDTLRCVELAVLHPAEAGEFRVFNQFTEQFSGRRARRAGAPRRLRDRARRPDRASGQSAGRAGGALLQRHAHQADGARPAAAPALRDADRVDVRRDRAVQGPRDPRSHPARHTLAWRVGNARPAESSSSTDRRRLLLPSPGVSS